MEGKFRGARSRAVDGVALVRLCGEHTPEARAPGNRGMWHLWRRPATDFGDRDIHGTSAIELAVGGAMAIEGRVNLAAIRELELVARLDSVLHTILVLEGPLRGLVGAVIEARRLRADDTAATGGGREGAVGGAWHVVACARIARASIHGVAVVALDASRLAIDVLPRRVPRRVLLHGQLPTEHRQARDGRRGSRRGGPRSAAGRGDVWLRRLRNIDNRLATGFRIRQR
mmetsp:Transcript_18080/g.52174  ORF Transcript_18080/g.52174 Transcript_18080/m.52174 type:complete len:229 (+) Transcript_18080:2188-2874(+)